jgi:hypothetical protein
MRLLAALILLVTVGTARAALNTESLPAGAVGIIAIDVAAFRETKVGQALEKLVDLKSKNMAASRQLNERLGIDAKKDLLDIVIGIYPGIDGKVSEQNASGVVLFRGKFLPASIEAFAKKNGVPAKTVGKHQAWEAGPFIEKLTGEKPKDNAKDAYLVAHSEDLVIIAGSGFLERALDAADRREKAVLLPAAIEAKFGATRNGWLYLYADATRMKGAKEDLGAENLSLVLGENATDLRLASAVVFATAEKAAVIRKQLAGLQAMATIGLMNDDGKSAEEKENMALLGELVQRIRIGGDGKQATLDVDFPIEKAVRALTKAIEKSQQAPAAK